MNQQQLQKPESGMDSQHPIAEDDQKQLEALNQQMKIRAQKFNSQYVPLSINQYKLFKIQKASETGNIKYLEGLLLNDIQDLQQRRKTIEKRFNKFFQSIEVQQDNNKFFAEKAVPDYSQDALVIRENSWYLFGVDYMSNQRIRHYFQSNPHFKIQWINDSSCNIIFNSAQEAKQAIKPYLKGDSMKSDEQEIWYELKQYEVQGVKRKLFCRASTNKDSKKQFQHGHDSKYYRWMINKQKMGKFVKKTAQRQIYNAVKGASKAEKTKPINKSHTGKVKKQEQQQSDESSSGVDSPSETKPKNNFKQEEPEQKPQE